MCTIKQPRNPGIQPSPSCQVDIIWSYSSSHWVQLRYPISTLSHPRQLHANIFIRAKQQKHVMKDKERQPCLPVNTQMRLDNFTENSPNIESGFSDESAMRDLQRSCWLLAAKNFKKKLKLGRGGELWMWPKRVAGSLPPLESQRAKYNAQEKLQEGHKTGCDPFIRRFVIAMNTKLKGGRKIVIIILSSKGQLDGVLPLSVVSTKSTEQLNNIPISPLWADMPIRSSTPTQTENCQVLLALSLWARRR